MCKVLGMVIGRWYVLCVSCLHSCYYYATHSDKCLAQRNTKKILNRCSLSPLVLNLRLIPWNFPPLLLLLCSRSSRHCSAIWNLRFMVGDAGRSAGGARGDQRGEKDQQLLCLRAIICAGLRPRGRPREGN